MSFTLYDGSVALAKDALKALSHIVSKAEAHENAANFISARLYEDMLPFSFQIFTVTDTAQKLAARGTGVEPLDLARDLNDYAAMHARITKVQEILDAIDKDAFNARAAAEVTIGMGPGKTATLTLQQYIHGYVVPNLFFHTTTAYGILRKEGVTLGKTDFLQHFLGKYLSQ
ncbi:hypothetical protein BGZ63DRAFT_407048 [Mariannaea sp. PMI_226]|nr:hypothetical protein BGZ63DRAFT_407048 [Mariannaea sp. PMI_226]